MVGILVDSSLIFNISFIYTPIAKTGELELDRAIVTREVGFYALAIVLLYIALRDIEPVEDDDLEHIFISFPEACLVFSGYIAYVIVCANMKSIVAFFGGSPSESGNSSSNGKEANDGSEESPLVPRGSPKYGSLHERTISQDIEIPHDLPYVTEKKNLSSEPASNWAAVSLYLPDESAVTVNKKGEESEGVGDLADGTPITTKESRQPSVTYTRSNQLVDLFQNTEPPSKTHDLYELRHNEVRHLFCTCFVCDSFILICL